LVDANVDRKGTRAAAQAYLEYLYSDEGQEIIAKHYYRPSNQKILEKYRDRFPDIKLFNITEIAENFQAAHKRFISDGGVFDTIYQTKKGS
ncbi:MAG: sulfate transporter subunit, partial [Thermodesulfobacteriota bacterium]